MIDLQGLTKRYGTCLAVDKLSLQVRAGEVFGFLGPNGAGKTTTLRMMAGLIKPTAGRVILGRWNIAGFPLEARRISGFIPDRPFLYGKLTGREFMRFAARLYEVDGEAAEVRTDDLFRLFHIQDYGDELIESYSHGMKQRLVMAAALIHQPDILIVDEPMVGLDPRGARLVKTLFRDIAGRGGTVFMSTHTLEVAEEVCDRIGIILGGTMVAVGTMRELREQAGADAGRLDSIFFKLTGGEHTRDIVQALRR